MYIYTNAELADMHYMNGLNQGNSSHQTHEKYFVKIQYKTKSESQKSVFSVIRKIILATLETNILH